MCSKKIIITQYYILIYIFDCGIYLTHIRPIVVINVFDRGIYLTHMRPIVPYCTIYYKTINVFNHGVSLYTHYACSAVLHYFSM